MQYIMCTCARTFSMLAGGFAPNPYSSFALGHTGRLPSFRLPFPLCSRSSRIKWQWVPLVQPTVVV